jgi:hypothetical protein
LRGFGGEEVLAVRAELFGDFVIIFGEGTGGGDGQGGPIGVGGPIGGADVVVGKTTFEG